MAYINYGQGTVGGKQIAELFADYQGLVAKSHTLRAWIEQIGVANLATNTDFSVLDADRQAFNDSFVQFDDSLIAFDIADGNGEKASRFARGS